MAQILVWLTPLLVMQLVGVMEDVYRKIGTTIQIAVSAGIGGPTDTVKFGSILLYQFIVTCFG